MKAVIFIHVLYLILMRTFTVKGATKCESKVQMRAVLLSCPAKDTGCDDDDPLSQVMKSEESQLLQATAKNFEYLREEKQRGFPNAVKDCKRKLVITLKVKNVGKIPCDDEFIVIDHVFDPVTGGRGRLLSPVVLKLRQEQMIQLYGLRFQRVVNSDPFEVQKAAGKTCSVDPENPTCGIAMYDGKPIPFSEGFCCSTDPHVNAKRQLSPVSHGESLLYRDSKLISQGNSRLSGGGKRSSAIVNPHLVRLKSAPSGEMAPDGKDSDCGDISSSLKWDKLPNFLLEHDKKIICDRGDFMNELCRLQEVKSKGETGLRRNPEEIGKSTRTEGRIAEMEEIVLDKAETVTMKTGDAKQVEKLVAMKGLQKALAGEQTTPSVGLSEQYVQVKGSRGKRENRKENKKLSLEEKLDRFASVKRHLTKRRKRLLELSRKRFRKDQCGNGEQCPTMSPTDYMQDDYVKSPPPKYFFSHDRYIIDPLESPETVMNSTCPTPVLSYDGTDLTKDKKYHHSMRNQMYKNFEGGKGEMMQKADGYYHKQGKMKEKYIGGKLNGKKDRVSHNEGGRIENSLGWGEIKSDGLDQPLRQTVSLRGEKRFSLYKSGDKGGKDDPKLNSEEELFRPQKFRYHSKKVNILHKDKKPTKPRIRNFFMARNHDRKFNPELVKGQKKAELNHKDKESFEGKNYKELLKEDAKRIESQADEKNMDDNIHGHLSMKPNENPDSSYMSKTENFQILPSTESQEMPESTDSSGHSGAFDLSTKKYDVEQLMHSLDDRLPKDKALSQQSKFKKPLKDNLHDTRARPPKDFTSDIDFNVEIIHNSFPDVKFRHHTPSADQRLKSRLKVVPESLDNKIYDKYGKSAASKTRLNLYYKPSQKYYIVQNDHLTPQDVYLVQGAKIPFSEGKIRQYHTKERPVAQSRPEGTFNPSPYKKSARRYYVPVVEYSEESKPRQREVLLSTREGSLPDARGKRYSEMLQRLESEEAGETPEGVGQWGRGKGRHKRSVSYSFEPARGFLRSELESPGGEEQKVHELEGCLGRERNRKVTRGDRWGGDVGGWDVSRGKHDNVSIEVQMVSTLEDLERKFEYPVMSSRGTEKREKKMRRASDRERLALSYLTSADYVLQEVGGMLKGKRDTDAQDSEKKNHKPDPPKPENTEKSDNSDNTEKSDNSDNTEMVENIPTNQENKKKEDSKEKSGEKDTFAGEYTQDTAHCMRFGDLWYSMYSIKRPVVAQIVGIQLYDKHSQCDGTAKWRELTKGKMIRVGTFLPKAEDELPSISMTFVGGKTKKVDSAIDPENYLLLIPSHVSEPSKSNSYPQLEAGPEEYLLVHTKDVSLGGECNMIGTSFEAFARQPDRCSQKRGSCLKRQPVDLWREDMEARIRGKRGKYFVENFGSVPNSPVKTYTNLTGEFLALEYYGEYSSVIEIEVKADANAIVRKGSNAQIPMVYIDSTYPKKIKIFLSVLNIGLTASYFRPRLGDCPPDLDPAWCPLEGPLVIIPPQQRHDFKLDLAGILPSSQTYMSVQVLNQLNRKIAHRKITIKKGDRCVCAFHCKCSCLGNLMGSKSCQKLSIDDYRKAGYIGQFPFRGGAASSPSESIIRNIHLVFLTAAYVLLGLGVLKGILGIFLRRIGIAGTRVITGPRQLCQYYESDLQCCSVLYDDCGFPVHPTTTRPVQIVPLWLETIINVFFFFLYPLRGIWFLITSLPCCKMVCIECEGSNRPDEGADSDQKSSRPLLSKNPQPTCVHYSLTTLNAMKAKQEEYLPYLPYKGDDDPLEEDDTEFVLEELKRYRKK